MYVPLRNRSSTLTAKPYETRTMTRDQCVLIVVSLETATKAKKALRFTSGYKYKIHEYIRLIILQTDHA